MERGREEGRGMKTATYCVRRQTSPPPPPPREWRHRDSAFKQGSLINFTRNSKASKAFSWWVKNSTLECCTVACRLYPCFFIPISAFCKDEKFRGNRRMREMFFFLCLARSLRSAGEKIWLGEKSAVAESQVPPSRHFTRGHRWEKVTPKIPLSLKYAPGNHHELETSRARASV